MATKQAIDKSIKQLVSKVKTIELGIKGRILFVKEKEIVWKFIKFSQNIQSQLFKIK